MATILYTWELGMGFGHLNRHLDVIRELCRRGHRVFFAARDVAKAERVLGAEPVALLQAPLMLKPIDKPIEPTITYTHILYGNGFNDPLALRGRLRAWQEIYRHDQPDLVIYDHSPTARLALRHLPARAIWCGTGFTVPPRQVPMPQMQLWEPVDEDQLLLIENDILAGVNMALSDLGLPALDSFAGLMDADATLLMTYRELDHYEPRDYAQYLGIISPGDHGRRPEWPGRGARRIFAYLHPFDGLPKLLEALRRSGDSVLVYAPEVPAEVRQTHSSESLVFCDEPLHVSAVMAECDLAVTNGTHATSCAALLAGKPLLLAPDNPERWLFTRQAQRLGAGLMPKRPSRELFADALDQLKNDTRFRSSAERFMQANRPRQGQWQTDQVLHIIESVLGCEP